MKRLAEELNRFRFGLLLNHVSKIIIKKHNENTSSQRIENYFEKSLLTVAEEITIS